MRIFFFIYFMYYCVLINKLIFIEDQNTNMDGCFFCNHLFKDSVTVTVIRRHNIFPTGNLRRSM